MEKNNWLVLEQAIRKNFVLHPDKDKTWVASKIVEGVKTMPEMVMTFVALDMGYDKETILTNLGVSEKYLDDLMKRITVCVNTNEKKFIRKVRLVRNYLKWNHRINF
jgi:hypothetical protein|tara:strand:+ start:2718 stop:3038 length:321 start_codon:yes stop_codon:yes gene_type:complete